jgi:predicted NUDIX family NTP pyrophosphohydrolase
MAKISAGLLLYREQRGPIEVFLVHPGGPFWANKDDGAWSIPKGLVGEGEDGLAAARREFLEETGCAVAGDFRALAPLKQASGKTVYAWAVRGDCDPAGVRSNTFEMEWPPKSGRTQSFLEVDRAAWFDLATAMRKILRGQVGFLEQLPNVIGSAP